MSVNEDIADEIVGNRLRLLRFEGGVVATIVRAFARAIDPLVKPIVAAAKTVFGGGDLTGNTRRNLLAQRERIDVEVRALHSSLRSVLAASVEGAAVTEGAAVAAVLEKTLPVALAEEVVHVAVADLVQAAVTPIGGLRWTDRLATDLFEVRTGLQAAVTQAVAQGLSVEDAAELIQAVTGLKETYRGRMVTIARTEIQRAANDAAMQTYRANLDVIGGVQWLSTLDSDTCIVCAGLHERSWKFDEAGNLPPGTPEPPAHPRCRCAMSPIVRSWREIGIDRDGDLNGKIPGEMDFTSWLRRQPVKVQRKMLGPARYELWAARKLSLASFSDAGRVLTLDELAQRYAVAR